MEEIKSKLLAFNNRANTFIVWKRDTQLCVTALQIGHKRIACAVRIGISATRYSACINIPLRRNYRRPRKKTENNVLA